MKLDNSTIKQLVLIIGINVTFILIFPFTFLSFENPVPIVTVLLFILLQAYFLRKKKVQLFLLLILAIISLFSLYDAKDTYAVSMKCGHELNKPVEQRNNERIREEEKNFETCLNSMTFVDYLIYGLLKK